MPKSDPYFTFKRLYFTLHTIVYKTILIQRPTADDKIKRAAIYANKTFHRLIVQTVFVWNPQERLVHTPSPSNWVLNLPFNNIIQS